MNKYLLLVIACLQTIFLQAATTTLLVGTNAEFPPFSFVESGEIVGFDIDVAREVGRRLGKEIELKDMPFDALLPDIILGRVDFVAAGMSQTEERAKRVLFSTPYLNGDPFVIFTLGSEKLTLEQLKGKTVVVVEGFTADQLMSKQEGVHLIRLPTQADAFMAVKSGRAEAFVTAETTVKAFLETQKISVYTAEPIAGTAETCCLVIPQSKPELLVEIQGALDQMEQDGTLNTLRKKWEI